MMSVRVNIEVTNGYTIDDGRSRWGNEEVIALNPLRNRSQFIDRVRCEVLARGPTKNARYDAYLTTEMFQYGVEGVLRDFI
jgi:hypothetical protein